MGIEFETDTVKKIHLPEMRKDMPLYMVSLIEHKSDVDYNVCMQLLRYTVCIWDDYAKTMEKAHPGISKTKGFRYPPVFPIVYYEGTGKWTAAMHVKERVFMNEIFASYIPDFTYRLVNVHQYTNEELLIHEDEMSLLMMINRIQTPQDFTDFLRSNQDEIREIMERASENIVQIIVNSLWALFMKMQVSVSEATDCLRKMIGGESMGNWFENMEPMNIQEERAKTKKAEEELEESVKAMFKLLKKLCPTKEQAVQELIESYDKTEEEAQKLVEQYW